MDIMSEYKDNAVDKQLRRTLTGRAFEFTIDGHDGAIRLHYPSYGIYALVMDRLEDAGLDRSSLASNPGVEMLRLASLDKRSMCEVLALFTVITKEEALGDDISIKAGELERLMTVEEVARTCAMCLAMDETEMFMRHYGLFRENDRYRRAVKVKSAKSESVSFGALTVYGSMFDPVMERYGWTLDYVLWGISYVNLKMLMADIPRTLHMTKEEMKKAGVADNKVIPAESIKDIDKLREMFPD